MILLNLLPHRELARKQRRELFNVHLALAVVVGVVASGMLYLAILSQLQEQEEKRNKLLMDKIALLDKDIKAIAALENDIANLKLRQMAVEDLQADRNTPVHMLESLSYIMPEGVVLQTIKQEDKTVMLQGFAQSQERVSEVLRLLGQQHTWIIKPDLQEVKATTLSTPPPPPPPGQNPATPAKPIMKQTFQFNIKGQVARGVGALNAQAGVAPPPPKSNP